ncbi:unnamed protein product [Sphacelaria rigidula]
MAHDANADTNPQQQQQQQQEQREQQEHGQEQEKQLCVNTKAAENSSSNNCAASPASALGSSFSPLLSPPSKNGYGHIFGSGSTNRKESFENNQSLDRFMEALEALSPAGAGGGGDETHSMVLQHLDKRQVC